MVALALGAIAGAIGAKLSNAIGDLNKSATIDQLTHKVLHLFSGAFQGFIVSLKDCDDKGRLESILAGGMGAVVSELVAEAMTPTHGGDLKPVQYTKEQIALSHGVAKTVTLLIGIGSGFDAVNLNNALDRATTALTHNAAYSLLSIEKKLVEEGFDEGYESDTSRRLRRSMQAADQVIADKFQSNQKPTWDDYALQNQTNNDYFARQENKREPDRLLLGAGYVAGASMICASAFVSGGLAPSIALSSGGAGMLAWTSHDFKITPDTLQNVGKSMLLGAIPATNLRYMVPAAAAISGFGYYASDDMLYYGGILAGGLGIAGKGIGSCYRYFTNKGVNSGGLDLATHSDWFKGPCPRGHAIEKIRGQNLPQNFKTIDRFDWQTGTDTSIKSRNLNAKTYLDPAKLERIMKRDIDALAKFKGAKLAGHNIEMHDIKSRILDIAIPHQGNTIQQGVFEKMVEYAQSQGVKLNIGVH